MQAKGAQNKHHWATGGKTLQMGTLQIVPI